jgi:hypothetical protein
MRDNDVPDTFEFNGTIIWITNETVNNIAAKAGSHWNAIRFTFL